VFLSFRGGDTRTGFTDFLYNSLVAAGVHVFRDDDALPVGKKIGPEILWAIRSCRIAIPIVGFNGFEKPDSTLNRTLKTNAEDKPGKITYHRS